MPLCRVKPVDGDDVNILGCGVVRYYHVQGLLVAHEGHHEALGVGCGFRVLLDDLAAEDHREDFAGTYVPKPLLLAGVVCEVVVPAPDRLADGLGVEGRGSHTVFSVGLPGWGVNTETPRLCGCGIGQADRSIVGELVLGEVGDGVGVHGTVIWLPD